VLNITGNAAIDVFIGLAFFYFLLSIFCSAINEAIATTFNLRAKDLERGIRNLLAEKADAFYADPRIQALHKPKRFLGWMGLPWLGKPSRGAMPSLHWMQPLDNKLPSYISSRAFALTVLDTFAPPDSKDGAAGAGGNLIARAEAVLPEVRKVNPKVAQMLQDALDEAGTDVEKFRTTIEQSFDETMDRVSGWYKRRVQLILFVIALVAVGAMNADSFSIAQRLWKNDALRSAVVAQSNAAVAKGKPACKNGGNASPQEAAKCLEQVKQLGIPLGWSKDTSPSGWGIPGKMLGLILTAFAILLGAPFWFDLLGKVSQLRGSGPPSGGGSQATPPAPAVQITMAKDAGATTQEKTGP
jgi:hypothetical protein